MHLLTNPCDHRAVAKKGLPALVLAVLLYGCLWSTALPKGATVHGDCPDFRGEVRKNGVTSLGERIESPILDGDRVASSSLAYASAGPWQGKAKRLHAEVEPTPPGQAVQLCQAVMSVPSVGCGTASAGCGAGSCGACQSPGCCGGWETARSLAWQAFAQGEYVAHARTAHVPEYRLRVDDQLDLIFRLTREETVDPYRLNVGDEIRVESFTDSALNRDLILQPDGTITLRLLGQVHATNCTVTQLRDELEKLYNKYYKNPSITVTPLKVNTKLEDLRATVDRRQGFGGQQQLVRVTPEGTVSLPALGSVPAQGLTLQELQRELSERYREIVEGIEVIPVLATRAPRYVFVLGEVRTPGRFELTGPTTVIQAISMAGGWNVGANLRQVVVFRRGDDWRLMATAVPLQAALLGNQPCPPGEIWLSDSDIVIVPKGPILIADEFIDLVFTRGLYGVIPFQGVSMNFSKLATL